MKKGELPELSARWWKASQPKGLASAGKLELALKAHEMAVSSLKKEPRADKLKFALDTLDTVKDAVTKTVTEAGRVKGNPEMDLTVQALQKIDYKKERAALEDAVGPEPSDDADGDEDGDADVSVLKNPVTYGKVLRKGLARVGERPVMWGFVAGTKAVDHRLLLHRTKNGRTIAIAAAKDLVRPAKISFGTLIRDPADEATILLTVQGAMLAGLASRIKRMLLALKPQPVSNVVLMVDGQVVPETVDPDDVDEADDAASAQSAPHEDPQPVDAGPGDANVRNPALEALHARIRALEPRAEAVMTAMPAYRTRVTTSIRQLIAAMEAENVAAAGPQLDKLEEVIRRLEGIAQQLPTEQPSASAQRAQQAAAEIQAALPRNVGNAVSFAKLRLRLVAANTARITAGANMEKSCLALVESGDYDDDPDLDALRAAARDISQRIPPLDGVTARVQDALDAASKAAPADRERELQPAVNALDGYLQDLNQDEMLRLLQNTPAGSFPIYDQIAGAVRDLRAALAA